MSSRPYRFCGDSPPITVSAIGLPFYRIPRRFELSINVSLRIFSCLNVIWHRMGLLLSRCENRTVCFMADA
jgi:hypothetical protein